MISTAPASPIDAATPSPIIELAGVAKRYGSGEAAVDALKGINLAIPAGQLVVVLGPSGSGKTTLLNLVGGIESATSGRIVVAGRALSSLTGDELTTYRREVVGFVFQFFNLVPTLTALENVQLIAELESDAGEGMAGSAEARSTAALADVGLADRAAHFPGTMSGGQQQRVAIARALVRQPPLLLCDEPTGSLDLDTGREVLALIRDAVTGGRTALLVTHNAAIARIADRVVRMGSGEIVEDRLVETPLPPREVEW